MGHRSAVDIFVTVQPDHFADVDRCVRSLRANQAVSSNRICIVAAALPVDLRSRLDALGCTYLHEADVCGFDVNSLPKILENRQQLFNQFLQWELRRFSTTPSYLVIDSSCELPASAVLFQGGNQTLFCENQFRFGQLMCFNYFFGQIPYPTAPASSHMAHFNKVVIDEMVAKIQGRWKTNWIYATLAILQQVPGALFNAADAFGHYLNIFYSGTFAVEPLVGPEKIANQTNVVRMSTLGFNGRFANQIFQYAFLRMYADQHGLIAECPPWIGCGLFGHSASLGNNALPIYREDKGETDEMIRFDADCEYKNFELWGYFQDSQHWANHRQQFRELFQPLPFLRQPLDEAVARLRSDGQTLVAIHVRRGDFEGGPVFWPAPEAWYLEWLEQIWPTLSHPVLYIATDDPQNVLPHFARFQPVTSADLNVTVNGAEFYPDFYTLTQCDVMGISNSTFSFAAAMLNSRANIFVRPDPDLEQMIDFDPWISEVQLRKSEPRSQRIAA